jgi:cytochrome c2
MRLPASSDALPVGYILAALFVSPLFSYAAGVPEAVKNDLAACAPCSPISQGVNMRGPPRASDVERSNGAAVGHRHSAPTAAAKLAGDDATHDQFLAIPAGYAPDERMYESILSSADRGNLAAYPDTAEGDREEVALPPQYDYHGRKLHRLSRGCAFHFIDLRHGLRC